jgi:hypothetical protein
LFKANPSTKTQNSQSPCIVGKFAVINRASFENGHRLKSISSQTRKSNRRLQGGYEVAGQFQMRPRFDTAMIKVYPLLLSVSNLALAQPCRPGPLALLSLPHPAA